MTFLTINTLLGAQMATWEHGNGHRKRDGFGDVGLEKVSAARAALGQPRAEQGH